LQVYVGWRRGFLVFDLLVLEVFFEVRPGGAIRSGSFLFEVFVKGAKVA
jgi:hypothetical protein